MTSRIYTVSDDNTDLLVRATSRAQAISYVARHRFNSRVSTQDDLATLISAGVKVDDATKIDTGERP